MSQRRSVSVWRMTVFGSAVPVTVAGVLLAGCATRSSPPAGGEPGLLRAAGVQRADVRDAPVSATAAGMTAFGYQLYRISADRSQNSVLSPLSIAAAFAMARAGARGETAAQIDKVLRFPATGLHEAFNAISRQVVTTGGAPARRSPAASRTAGKTEPPTVSLANGLFVQNGFVIRDAFLRILAAQYGAGVRTVDFAAGDAAKRQIDEWVRRQTAGLIEKLFDQLDPTTRLVLANALYLRADWQLPFAESPTADATFTRADGSSVQAPMMHQAGRFRYAVGNGWQAVELPYAGGELAMRVLVPAANTAPTHLLSPGTLAAVAAGLRDGPVDLWLPRWKSTSSLDLAAQLQKLGMAAPFTSSADFSGIADDLYIQQAVHRATITVDEWGTEAAAVTGLSFVESAGRGGGVTIRADHPFAFAIVHIPTNVPLFIGQVADPTTES
jgi:serine protease inhibitor